MTTPTNLVLDDHSTESSLSHPSTERSHPEAHPASPASPPTQLNQLADQPTASAGQSTTGRSPESRPNPSPDATASSKTQPTSATRPSSHSDPSHPQSTGATSEDPSAKTHPQSDAKSDAQPHGLSSATIALAAKDVRLVLEEQREQSQILTTKLNILFVTNGALLTSLSISRLMVIPSIFSILEVVGFLTSFLLLVRAFLPRQVAVSPNLEDRKFLEKYLTLDPDEYQLQMLVNLAETYNANKQRLDDVSQSLQYAAYATLSVAVVMMAHMLFVYFVL